MATWIQGAQQQQIGKTPQCVVFSKALKYYIGKLERIAMLLKGNICMANNANVPYSLKTGVAWFSKKMFKCTKFPNSKVEN